VRAAPPSRRFPPAVGASFATRSGDARACGSSTETGLVRRVKLNQCFEPSFEHASSETSNLLVAPRSTSMSVPSLVNPAIAGPAALLTLGELDDELDAVCTVQWQCAHSGARPGPPAAGDRYCVSPVPPVRLRGRTSPKSARGPCQASLTARFAEPAWQTGRRRLPGARRGGALPIDRSIQVGDGQSDSPARGYLAATSHRREVFF
jgi:hypothetical protein